MLPPSPRSTNEDECGAVGDPGVQTLGQVGSVALPRPPWAPVLASSTPQAGSNGARSSLEMMPRGMRTVGGLVLLSRRDETASKGFCTHRGLKVLGFPARWELSL